MNILSIETSCDETAVALVRADKRRFDVFEDLVSSQVKIHAPFGGVVPNLAAREHLKNLPILLKKTLQKHKLRAADIDLIAITQGPGLIPALLIGTNSAKALAYAWKKPLVGVHHIAGHIYANFTQGSTFPLSAVASNSSKSNLIKFPILALIVSGGHTQLILMKKHMDFRIVGETLDDAAGEAFDKVAKILNLGYPGGPAVAAEAEKFLKSKRKISNFSLPRPMINSNNLNFSFSGLKTAVLYKVKSNPKILKDKLLTAELCAEFQQAEIDVLVSKTLRAAKKYNPKTILLGGGVSANKKLREQLGKAIKNNLNNVAYKIPDVGYSLDNAVMIAAAAFFQHKLSKNKKKFLSNWRTLEANAGLKLN